MTYRQAVFLKLILHAGFLADYSLILEEIIDNVDLLGGILLELSYCDKDSTRSINILEKYIAGKVN